MNKFAKLVGVSIIFSIIAVCFIIHHHRKSVSNNVFGDVIPLSIQQVSLINLIATPERYHGKNVVVYGFVRLQFEGTSIFLHRDYDALFMTREAIWLDIPEEWGDEWINNKGKCFDKKYCLIAGTFDATTHGHFGNYSGTLKNIIRIASVP